MKNFSNVIELLRVFSSEKICLKHLEAMRWQDGIYCPHCGGRKIFKFSDGVYYKCAACRKKFTAKVGSIFEDSKIPLQKWFMAIYYITAHKKGISSLQLSRDLGVTQKTAWFMLHRLRHASKTKAFSAPLKNVIEVDETYIGGKERNKHANKKTKGVQGRSTEVKTPVLVALERKGIIKAKKVTNLNSQTVGAFLTDNVVIGSKLMSDEYRVYQSVKWLYNHLIVNHGRKEYVNGDIHINTAEGFFSLLKRGIVGIYHFVSEEHLGRYLNEFTFRYNTREYTGQDRFNFLISNCDAKRLTYKELIANG